MAMGWNQISGTPLLLTINMALQWCHNGCDGISNHQPHDCLLNHLFRRRSKRTSKTRVTGLCVGNSPVTGEFPAQMASNMENVSIWWRHHGSPYTGMSSHYLYNDDESLPSFLALLRGQFIDTLRPKHNGCHFPDDILKCIFLNEKCVNFD